MKMKFVMLMLVALLALLSGIAQANMLANPGFEEGTFTGALDNFPPDWSLVSPGYTSAYTWLSDAGAHSGDKYLRLQPWYVSPSYNPGVHQSVTGVIAGGDYEFSVWTKNGVEDDTNVQTYNIEWHDAGGVISSHVVDIDVISTEWTLLDFGTFTAPEGAIAASFSITLDGYNPSATYIDDASMVPEPVTLSLLGLGVLMLRRRRKT